MGDYRKLKVWRKAHELALFTYRATERMPRTEQYGLTSQMRRAAVSVPSNIAEGASRNGDRDMARFIGMAIGSVNELQYQFRFATDLGWISGDAQRHAEASTSEIRAMLDGLRRKVVGVPRAGREPH